MNNLELYVVCHNKESFDYFVQLNPTVHKRFKYILVGNYKEKPDWFVKNGIIANLLADNIEEFKTLLTFTAWYALVKNNLIKSKYIGIFEYDCEILDDVFDYAEYIDDNSLIAFKARMFPDRVFMKYIPEFNELLPIEYKEALKGKMFWGTTSNFIMPIKFIYDFVDWYCDFIPDILPIENHPHIHERAINIYAFKNDYRIILKKGLMHYQLCSHKIRLKNKIITNKLANTKLI